VLKHRQTSKIAGKGVGVAYAPMRLEVLAGHLATAETSDPLALVAEFLEEYRWEPVDTRRGLLLAEPPANR
jgi:hypothetical protein